MKQSGKARGARRHRSKRGWLTEHHRDRYVRQARQAGYRSRSAYKLLQLDERDRLFHPGMIVVDLGAAPGGWSQVAAQRGGERCRVIAVDRLPVEPLPRVEVISGDIEDDETIQSIINVLRGDKADLVISDMAPNISGMSAVDQPKSIYLAELAVDLGYKVLKSGGDILVKVFQGASFDAFVQDMRRDFARVLIRKPQASRARSREVYLLARGFGGGSEMKENPQNDAMES